MGVPPNGWFIREIPLKWMRTGGSSVSGNPHMEMSDEKGHGI